LYSTNIFFICYKVSSLTAKIENPEKWKFGRINSGLTKIRIFPFQSMDLECGGEEQVSREKEKDEPRLARARRLHITNGACGLATNPTRKWKMWRKKERVRDGECV